MKVIFLWIQFYCFIPSEYESYDYWLVSMKLSTWIKEKSNIISIRNKGESFLVKF